MKNMFFRIDAVCDIFISPKQWQLSLFLVKTKNKIKALNTESIATETITTFLQYFPTSKSMPRNSSNEIMKRAKKKVTFSFSKPKLYMQISKESIEINLDIALNTKANPTKILIAKFRLLLSFIVINFLKNEKMKLLLYSFIFLLFFCAITHHWFQVTTFFSSVNINPGCYMAAHVNAPACSFLATVRTQQY